MRKSAAAATSTGTWDTNRKAVDPTGFVNKVMGKMPSAEQL